MDSYWQEELEHCPYTIRLLDKVQAIAQAEHRSVDMYLIKKAIYYAKTYHGTQMRDSGEPFYSHPLEVAYMLADYLLRTDLLITAILHDTIEDTPLTKEIIATAFGKNIANKVADLTRIKKTGKISSKAMVESLYIQKKLDILLIKLFDRVHNVQTIGAKSPEKMTKILEETLESFLWVAAYLELTDIENKFKKTCCDFLMPRSPGIRQPSKKHSILENLISDSNFF
jgi:guanosine-3',5'-bis(diphosphate) 3'-pyrophosphohydrolase